MTEIMEPQALPGLEAQVNEYDEAQLQAAASRRVFEANEGPYPWLDVYWELRARGWDWRKAVYIAWLAMPEGHREPKTQHQLATEAAARVAARQPGAGRGGDPAAAQPGLFGAAGSDGGAGRVREHAERAEPRRPADLPGADRGDGAVRRGPGRAAGGPERPEHGPAAQAPGGAEGTERC